MFKKIAFIYLLISVGVGFSQDQSALNLRSSEGAKVKAQFYTKNKLQVLQSVYEGQNYLPKNNYVGFGIIKIMPNSKLCFASGSKIYLEPGTSFLVNGEFEARGDSLNPVSFSGLSKDTMYVVLDELDTLWNEISIESSGAIRLSNTTLSDMKNGIVVNSIFKDVSLKNISFKNIAVSHLVTHKGEGVSASLVSPFSMHLMQVTTNLMNTLPLQEKVSKKKSFILPLGISFSVLSVGAIVGVFVFDKSVKNNVYNANLALDIDKAETYSKKAENALVMRNVSWGIAGAMALSATATFVIPNFLKN